MQQPRQREMRRCAPDGRAGNSHALPAIPIDVAAGDGLPGKKAVARRGVGRDRQAGARMPVRRLVVDEAHRRIGAGPPGRLGQTQLELLVTPLQ